MSEFVLDASIALKWFLEDETDRRYSLEVLSSLSEDSAIVPILWFYEVGNGLLMAHRRKRISSDQIENFLIHLKTLPIEVAQQFSPEILELPALAKAHNLTIYDAAYLALAIKSDLALATNDNALRKAAVSTGIKVL